ncbi:uncharacterized protein LOC129121906 isoform X2 [Agelaius phoeniceus]|uniref:uncharacterized protein LOC129121906 isoform X2 n=1 Tax=Agelaius phoeniceus TaxID=39638 RepID=UPI004054A5B1
MPIPGAVTALGVSRNRGGQVPKATDFPRTYQLTSRSAARRCVAARSSASRSRSVCEATFITQVWARTVQGPVFSSGRRIFLRLPETTFPRTSDCWGVI